MNTTNNLLGLSRFGPGSRVGAGFAMLAIIAIAWIFLSVFKWNVVSSNFLVSWLVKNLGNKTSQVICILSGILFLAFLVIHGRA